MQIDHELIRVRPLFAAKRPKIMKRHIFPSCGIVSYDFGPLFQLWWQIEIWHRWLSTNGIDPNFCVLWIRDQLQLLLDHRWDNGNVFVLIDEQMVENHDVWARFLFVKTCLTCLNRLNHSNGIVGILGTGIGISGHCNGQSWGQNTRRKPPGASHESHAKIWRFDYCSTHFGEGIDMNRFLEPKWSRSWPPEDILRAIYGQSTVSHHLIIGQHWIFMSWFLSTNHSHC